MITDKLKNGRSTLSFSLYKNNPFINEIEEEFYVETFENRYIIKSTTNQQTAKRYMCVLDLESLESKLWIDGFSNVEATADATVRLAIAGTGWSVEARSLTTKKRTLRLDSTNAYEIITKALTKWDIEVRFSAKDKVITLSDNIGEDKGVYFTDELNLSTVNIEGDSTDFATRLYVRGKDGLTFADINGGKDYIENFTYSDKVVSKLWVDERYEHKESMLEDARIKLEGMCKPVKSYELEIVDLASLSQEYDFLAYGIGDTVTLLSASNKIRESHRIIEMTRYPLEPERNKAVLSNGRLTFEELQQKNEEMADTVDGWANEDGSLNGSKVDGILTEQITDFEAKVAQITDLSVVNAKIDNLEANKASIGQLSAVVADIGELRANTATIDQLKATNAQIDNLKAQNVTISGNLQASNAQIGVLESTVANIEKLYATKADIDELRAVDATIENAMITKADIHDLNAAVADIGILNADLATIKHLVGGNISSDNIQTGGITSDKLTIANGFIKDAMIDSLNANKIVAGRLDTALVQVSSKSGNLVINDNTIQIRDANRVRVQIGKDASNDYSMSVWDSSGKLMFDARGLKADAIKDSIIRDDMIAPGANIDGSKLNISSVVSSINNGSSTLKASKVEFDGIAQTLEVAFNALKIEVDETKSITESNTTAINVAQGKINTLIQDTTITKNGQTIKLKDEYSRLEQSVSGLSSTVGAQQTTIDEHTGKITATNSEISSLKQNVDGLSMSVSSAQTKIETHEELINNKADLSVVGDIALKANASDVYKKDEVYTKSQTDAQIKVAKDAINLGVSATYETKENVESKATLTLNSAKSYADAKKQEAINSASTDATNKVNSAKNDLNTAINQKANSFEVYKKSETYTKAETDSKIKVAKDGIDLSISTLQTTVANHTTQINNKADLSVVDEKIDNIQVGGRNLIIRSNEIPNKMLDQSGALVSSDTTSVMRDFISVNAGETLTFQKEDGSEQFRWNCYDAEKKFISRVSNRNNIFQWRVPENARHIWVSYPKKGDVKIEKGTKATDWSPAPEDVQTSIDTKANITDVYQKSEVYTKAQTDSQINIAKDAINLGVSTTYETKENVEFKATLTLDSAKSYADTKKQEAINSASTDATNKVNSAKSELNTSINQKANSVDVYKKTETYTKSETDSKIKVAKDSITQSVSTTYETKSNVTTQINGVKNTISSLQTRVNTAEQKITDSAIVSTVTSSQTYRDDLSDKVSTEHIISSINQTAEAIKIDASKIDLSGYVTISNLSGNGTTSINGANIKTGVIKSTDSSFWLDLNNSRMAIYDNSKLLAITHKMRDNKSGKYGLGFQANRDSFIALSIADNDDNTIYKPYIALAAKQIGDYKAGINLLTAINVNQNSLQNPQVLFNGFERNAGDYATLYAAGSKSSGSKLMLELGDDFYTTFEIWHKFYNKSGADFVASFRAAGGSESNVSNVTGIKFFQNLGMQGKNIWGIGTARADLIETQTASVKEIDVQQLALTKIARFNLDEDIKYRIPASLLESIEHFGYAELSDNYCRVDFPIGFNHRGYILTISPLSSGDYEIIKCDEYFEIRGNIKSFDYIVKGYI